MSLPVDPMPGDANNRPTPIYPLRLLSNAGAADTMLWVDNLNDLPQTGAFVGVIDRGTMFEEKVLCKRSQYPGYLEAVRGWDYTGPFKHAAFNQSAEALQLAASMGIQMQRVFGSLSPEAAASLDPHRLQRMEELVFAPVYEWVAEGEARAVREFELA